MLQFKGDNNKINSSIDHHIGWTLYLLLNWMLCYIPIIQQLQCNAW